MKSQLLFVHSAGSQGMNDGSSNLVAYLKNKLGDAYEVLYPIMPQPDNPQYKGGKPNLKGACCDGGSFDSGRSFFRRFGVVEVLVRKYLQ